MESDWQQFTILLEEKISARVAPLEDQLNQQQELISKLTYTLTTMLELINKKPGSNVEQGKAEIASSDKVTGKTESSDHDEEKQAGSGKE